METAKQILQQIQDPDYWKNLNPGLSVEDSLNPSAFPEIDIEQEHLDNLFLNLKEEGYFQIDPVFSDAEIFSMAMGLEILHQEGWQTTWAFVYDEFWQIFRQLSSLLCSLLGKDYRQLPAFWAWYVDTNNTAAGWMPHRDRSVNTLQPDGMPKSLTIWIPLTDAIPLNGCMYILPAALDPNYPDNLRYIQVDNLQNIRALPAGAGSVLCWNQAVLHWGGRSSDKSPLPRLSLACEFQRGDMEPLNQPLLAPEALPSFNQRLALIGKQILQYQNVYRWPTELIEIALELEKTID